MKSLLVTASIAMLCGATAHAADLGVPYVKSAPFEQVYSWTGFYIGGNVGYGITESPASVVASDVTFGPQIAGSGRLAAGGVIGGGQIGYNWQPSSTWLFGVEADFQGSDQKATLTTSAPIFAIPNPAPFVSAESRLRYFGTVRGRVGYLFTPATFIYATAGLAYGQTELNLSADTQAIFGTASSTRFRDTKTGFTAGGGIETKLWGNWSAKAEYLYLDLRSMRGQSPDLVVVSSANVQFRDHIVRAGLNYKLY